MTLSFTIDDTLNDRIQRLATQQQRSPHGIMMDAIRHYVEREEAREGFKQEALTSWAEFQKTGRHLTGQEVQDWLSRWGNDEETAAPECHG